MSLVRLAATRRPCLEILGPAGALGLARPLLACPVPAGFPSAADDHLDRKLDLNEYLVAHPEATFYLRVAGDSMRGAGIHAGDLLVVDRAVEPVDGQVVVAMVDGELTVKRLVFRRGRLALSPENPAYKAIELDPEAGVDVWGVVTHVIHKV
jgi:DNA polymerase V